MMAQAFRPGQRLGAALGCGVGGILSAMSFVVSAEGHTGMSDAPASSTSLLWGALALCFALLFWQVWVRRAMRPHPLSVAFGLLFGVVNTLGGMLFAYDSWAVLGSGTVLLLTALRCVGQSLPMMAALERLHGALQGGALTRPGLTEQLSLRRLAWLRRLWQRHPVLCPMALLLLCWSPYLIAYYPGTVCWDLGEMVAQFFGMRELDTWHPIFTTGLIGGLVWLGRQLGSDNLGAALFMLLQALALSFALARGMVFLKRLGMNRAVRLGALCFFAFAPIWPGYAQFISNDTLYTSVMLLFMLQVAQVLLDRQQSAVTGRKTLFGLCGYGLLCCLLRSNGPYVVLPTAAVLVLFGAKGRARLPLTAALAGVLCGLVLFTQGLIPALGIKDETASGIYSVCFQQSARVLRDHGQEVTPEEYAEIDRVLEAEALPELYEPFISDPVKYTFRFYGQGAAAEKEALVRYRTAWLKMAAKYPLTYAEAFFAGNVSYYAFTPKIEGKSYNDQAGNRLVFETYDVGTDPAYLHTRQIGFLEEARTLLAVFARGWRHIPLLGVLYCCAAYTWLLVGAALSALRQKKALWLIAFLPALMSLAVCMLSPVNDYFRYFLPIVAMTFPLLALCGGKVMPPPEPTHRQA